MTVLLKIDPAHPDDGVLARAVGILRQGGVVAFPTETFYGLGADAHQGSAVEKIFRLKGRVAQNPIAVIVASERDVPPLVHEAPAAARILMEKFWPGPLTILFPASAAVSPQLTAGTGKIGIRVSSHPVARLLADGIAGPLTATSANLSGGPECTTAQEVLRAFGENPAALIDAAVDAVIDGGSTPGGLGSTILDTTLCPPRILREGALSRRDIEAALGAALGRA